MSLSNLYRYIVLLSSLFFGLSAVVQINDPDPEVWIIVYTLPTIFSLIVAVKPHCRDYLLLKRMSEFAVMFYCAFGCFIFKTFDFKTNFMEWIFHDEAGREFGGITIAAIWTWLLFHSTQDLSFKNLFVILLCIIFPTCVWIYIYFNESVRQLWPKHCQSIAYSSS